MRAGRNAEPTGTTEAELGGMRSHLGQARQKVAEPRRNTEAVRMPCPDLSDDQDYRVSTRGHLVVMGGPARNWGGHPEGTRRTI